MPTFDELYVVSDLHIGGEDGFQIFQSGKLLGGFIAALAGGDAEKKLRRSSASETSDGAARDFLPLPAPDATVGLVLNGDVVDFLAEAPVTYLDVRGAIKKLQQITQREPFKPVFDALRLFVRQPGRELVLVLGNHDLELALPHVQEWLRRDLATGGDGKVDDAARGRITFATDGAGFRCTVAGAAVLCFHGEIADDWNRVDHQGLRSISHQLNQGVVKPSWTPNGGTQLVVDVMNDIKRRRPFVDLLKPEREAMLPILYAIDQSAHDKLLRVVRPWLKQIESGVWRERFLGSSEKGTASTTKPENDAQTVLARAALEFIDCTSEVADIFQEVEHDMRRGVDPALAVMEEAGDLTLLDIRSVARALAAAGKTLLSKFFGDSKEQTLLVALRSLLQEDRTFALGAPDEPYRWAEEHVWSAKSASEQEPNVEETRFVIAGHTHLERWIAGPQGTYFNSGTWASLIKLDKKDLESLATFESKRKKLEKAGSVAELFQLGLAEVRPTVVAIRNDAGSATGALHTARFTAKGVRLEVRNAERNGHA